MCKFDWIHWLKMSCLAIAGMMDEKSIVFFYQTNRKFEGSIIDKKNIITNEFLAMGFNLIHSKIVLKQEPETINLFRPTFTNFFSFSKSLGPGKPSPDVIRCGEMIYKNAMGYNACRFAVEYVKEKKVSDTILDPFCGRGSVLKIANDLGMKSMGIDIDIKQVEHAKNLK